MTQLVIVTPEFAGTLDNNIQVDTICLDSCEAFDEVPHGKLIYELNKTGLPKVSVAWVSEYLSNQVQHVTFEGQNLSLLPVRSCAPEDGVLGPLVFFCYINDIVIDPTIQIRFR